MTADLVIRNGRVVTPTGVIHGGRAVEDHGFSILGISDSQSICRDVYVRLALWATRTERIRLGPRVITPAARCC